MGSTKVTPPPPAAAPITDPIAAFGLVVGWVLILAGLMFLVRALLN